MKLKDYLNEGSLNERKMNLRAEVKKAYSRFEQFGGNTGKINKRTKTMRIPVKLIAWYIVLENENFHRENQLVVDRYFDLTGLRLTASSEYRTFHFIDEIPEREIICPTCRGAGKVRR